MDSPVAIQEEYSRLQHHFFIDCKLLLLYLIVADDHLVAPSSRQNVTSFVCIFVCVQPFDVHDWPKLQILFAFAQSCVLE